MNLKVIGEITGLSALVFGGFAEVQMSWIAAFLAAAWSAILIGRWLYGQYRRWSRK